MPAPFRLSLLAPVFFLLASCGGGDDGGTVETTGVPGSSHTSGSPQAAAFQRLNAARAQCGFTTLSQAGELDAAASAHASYMNLNNSFTHSEVRGQPGFTGVSVGERVSAAGYRFSFTGEALAQTSAPSGLDAVRGLLAAPYHAALLLNDFRDVGVGWSSVAGAPTLTLNVGTRLGQPLSQPSRVLTYPCNGITDAVPAGSNEAPSPFPANPAARWGQPVMVRGPADLALTSASITGPQGDVQVQAIYGEGQAADPNATGDFTRGSFAIIPAPLQPNTTYTVSIEYRTGGVSGRTDFSFATAAR